MSFLLALCYFGKAHISSVEINLTFASSLTAWQINCKVEKEYYILRYRKALFSSFCNCCCWEVWCHSYSNSISCDISTSLKAEYLSTDYNNDILRDVFWYTKKNKYKQVFYLTLGGFPCLKLKSVLNWSPSTTEEVRFEAPHNLISICPVQHGWFWMRVNAQWWKEYHWHWRKGKNGVPISLPHTALFNLVPPSVYDTLLTQEKGTGECWPPNWPLSLVTTRAMKAVLDARSMGRKAYPSVLLPCEIQQPSQKSLYN
jgi:hypothetical protein